MAEKDKKVVIITGANSGIGFRAAEQLCKEGHEVILACRNTERGMSAVGLIKDSYPQSDVLFLQLDLADLSSVRQFVEEFKQLNKPLHILALNAGLTMNFKGTERSFTKDGFEITMGTNHLGHFLLTHLLLDILKKTAADDGEARIVVTTSSLHNPESKGMSKDPPQALDPDDLFLAKPGVYTGFQAYRLSKAANVMFTYELARRLEGTGVTCNAFCPGFIPETGLGQHQPAFVRFFVTYVLGWILWWKGVTTTLEDGSKRLIDVATNPEHKGVTAKYFNKGQPSESSAESYEEAKQKHLWEVSAGLLKLEGYPPLEPDYSS